MTNTKTQPRDLTPVFNRVLYVIMVLLTLYYLIFNRDVSSAMSTLGIGLIFDPFKPEVRWSDRPRYQKAVLLVHVSAVLGMVGLLLFRAMN